VWVAPEGLLRVKDQFVFALRAMTDRRLRTALTIIGIVIGPATIVSLVAATQGYSNAASAQFDKLGATTIFVSSTARGFSLTQSNLGEIQSQLGVSAALPYQMLSGSVNQGGESVSVQIVATDLSKLTSVFPSLSIEYGSLPSSSDLSGAIVGHSVAFPNLSGASNLTLNQILSISTLGRGASFGPQAQTQSSSSASKSFIVRGIYNSFGQGFFLNPDEAVFIPLATGEALLHSYSYSGVMVVASSASVVNQVESELTNLFGTNVRVTSVTSILSTIQSVTQSTSTLLEAVGGISVLVAFIAIMTTEFTSVLERTKEIGILKALGANSRTIMLSFISEALVTGFLGGVIGAAAGSAFSFLIVTLLQGSGTRIPGTGAVGGGTRFAAGGGFVSSASSSPSISITPALSPELLLLAIGLATVVGGLAGLLPAWRASRLPPVEALRAS